jgi:hypothetical protein
MAFCMGKQRILAGAVLAGLAFAAGCQSNDTAGALEPKGGGTAAPQVKESELRAFCPPVMLREGTAYFNTYERGAKDKDPAKLEYQASIGDVTRSCTYPDGLITMDVAVAGRIVPGPKGKAGTITMPIRVVVVQDGQVVYSQLHKYPVAVTDTVGATQFVFSDPAVSIPRPSTRSVVVYAGYDEGPPKK